MESGKFVYQITDEVHIDVATISKKDWDRIKNDVKFLMQSKQFDDIGRAYVAAFLAYLIDIVELSESYDPTRHKSM